MTKYLALLRGVNVGGKNKVSMKELKLGFEKLSFRNVSTYINSGNVLFESDETDKAKLVTMCEKLVNDQFDVSSRIAVITAKELDESLKNAPKWWGSDKASKHNAVVVIAPASAREIMADAGDIKPEYEKLDYHGNVIFWSAPLDTFGRTRYAKIVGTKAYQHVTIRNSKTMKKLHELTKKVI